MCYKGYSHLFSITCDISTVSELKMREQCYIKINNNNNNNNICIQAAHTLLRTGVPPSNPSSESCFSHHFDHSLWFLCVSVPTAIAHTRCTQEFPPSNLSCESCFNHHFDHSAGGGVIFVRFYANGREAFSFPYCHTCWSVWSPNFVKTSTFETTQPFLACHQILWRQAPSKPPSLF